MPDPHKAFWQHMQQEPADKLEGIYGCLICLSGIPVLITMQDVTPVPDLSVRYPGFNHYARCDPSPDEGPNGATCRMAGVNGRGYQRACSYRHIAAVAEMSVASCLNKTRQVIDAFCLCLL